MRFLLFLGIKSKSSFQRPAWIFVDLLFKLIHHWYAHYALVRYRQLAQCDIEEDVAVRRYHFPHTQVLILLVQNSLRW